MSKLLIGLIGILGLLLPANAAFKEDSIFRNGTVFQHGQPIFIYGESDPGTRVKVTLNGKSKTVKTEDNGKWIAELRAMKPEESFVYLEMECKLKTGKAERKFKVYIGDVYLFAGGGNIDYSFKNFKYLKSDFGNLAKTEVRGIPIAKHASDKPEETSKTYMNHAWAYANDERHGESNNPLSVFFAYKVNEMFEYPVGILKCGYKNTTIESWIPAKALEEAGFEAKESKNKDGKVSYLQSSSVYNGMVHPFTKLAIKGVVWYPSIADVRNQKDYGKKMQTLITSWREAFNNPEMPFFIIQAQSSGRPSWNTNGHALAFFREAQMKALELPYTYLTGTTDLGEEKSFYTESQKKIADRMLIHLVKMKRKKTINYGPTLKRMTPNGFKINLEFDNADNGLEARDVNINIASGLKPGSDPDGHKITGEKVVGFEVCGRDGVFHPAEAKIRGRSVELYSKKVRRPLAVRYGWSSIVKANLYHKEGLPALPFRTDKLKAPNFEGELESKEVTVTSIIGQPMEALMKVGENTLQKVKVDGADLYKAVPAKGKKEHYAFFKNTNSDIKDGKKPKLKIMVAYLDEGSGVIEIRYDSSDQKVVVGKNKPGLYKLAGKIKLTGTNTLRYVEIDVPDGQFSSRHWGPSDIRLKSNRSFKISGVFVQPL